MLSYVAGIVGLWFSDIESLSPELLECPHNMEEGGTEEGKEVEWGL